MEWILSIPSLVNIPQPNIYNSQPDKYDLIAQIKYFSFCKRVLMKTINVLEDEIENLQNYKTRNGNYDMIFQMENTMIEHYKYQVNFHLVAYNYLTPVIDNLWSQIRN